MAIEKEADGEWQMMNQLKCTFHGFKKPWPMGSKMVTETELQIS
jgi:hypothetical protein